MKKKIVFIKRNVEFIPSREIKYPKSVFANFWGFSSLIACIWSGFISSFFGGWGALSKYFWGKDVSPPRKIGPYAYGCCYFYMHRMPRRQIMRLYFLKIEGLVSRKL